MNSRKVEDDSCYTEMWDGIVTHYLASETRPVVDVYLRALGSLARGPRGPHIEEGDRGASSGVTRLEP